MQEPWYVHSFGKDYVKIYAHRTDEAAREEVEQIVRLMDIHPPLKVLDLCCGNGRHSRALAELGFRVTGIDLSSFLLDIAEKRNKEARIRYLQHDVRDLPFQEEFDIVLNLFTSFGYFEQLEENMKVFASINRSLKQGGQFLIDFLNPGYVEKNLVAHSERETNGLHITERRQIKEKRVIKDIEVEQNGDTRYYQEQVNLFEYDEMASMIRQSGLYVAQVYGDFKHSPYHPLHSQRMIILGGKE